MGEIVRVLIDGDARIHHGCCRDACPEVFQLPGPDDEGTVALLVPGAEARFRTHDRQIREAVLACPVSAVRIEER